MGQDLDIDMGDRTLVLHNRYETLSILNDALIAVWFIVGSLLFFDESTSTVGTWFFLAGSIELLIRPIIRLSRNVHLRSVSSRTTATTGSNDF